MPRSARASINHLATNAVLYAVREMGQVAAPRRDRLHVRLRNIV